jgi:phosphopantetheine adenylyltransferase
MTDKKKSFFRRVEETEETEENQAPDTFAQNIHEKDENLEEDDLGITVKTDKFGNPILTPETPKKGDKIEKEEIITHQPRRETTVQQPKKFDNAILELLNKAVKNKQKITIELEVDLVKPEVVKLIKENFEGSGEMIIDYLASLVNKEELVKKIQETISKQYE